MEGEPATDQLIVFKFEGVADYSCHAKLDKATSIFAKVTTLLWIVDMIKEKVGVAHMENKETQIFFDEDNLTSEEETIQTKMDFVLIKRQGPVNPFLDQLEVG